TLSNMLKLFVDAIKCIIVIFQIIIFYNSFVTSVSIMQEYQIKIPTSSYKNVKEQATNCIQSNIEIQLHIGSSFSSSVYTLSKKSGNFFLLKYGILVELSENTLFCFPEKEEHGITIIPPEAFQAVISQNIAKKL
ncbi:5526_t:CDS:2, partial [Funneliformis geosporum]